MSRGVMRDPRSRSRKPDIRTAMRSLIDEVRQALPFESAEAQRCSGDCNGCSKKLLDYLETELDDWEHRLASGEKPGLDDLSRLVRTSRKVHRVLVRNGLIDASVNASDQS